MGVRARPTPSVESGWDHDDGELAVHYPHGRSSSHAYALSRLADRPTGPTPIGVFRAIDRPVYGAAMTAELEAAHERAGDEQLERLLRGGETWTVS